MFRRRPLRALRPVVRAAVASSVPRVPPVLQRANQLMADGDYRAAAEAFEMLARGAESRGIPRAPHLYLRAGQARLLAGETEVGMAHLRLALSRMAASGQWQVLDQAGSRVVAELNEAGLTKEAQEISEYVKSALAGAPAGYAQAGTAGGKALPTHCPGCGGPLRASETTWLDSLTAECPYCGSPVRGE